MRRISKIKNDSRMRLRAPTVRKSGLKINAAIKMQGAIGIDVDVEAPVVGGGVDVADVAGLHKVVGHHNVFLVRGDFDVMRAQRRLLLVGVVEALWVVEIGDVERGDVIGCRDGYCKRG